MQIESSKKDEEDDKFMEALVSLIKIFTQDCM
jgi:hypothetical protein